MATPPPVFKILVLIGLTGLVAAGAALGLVYVIQPKGGPGVTGGPDQNQPTEPEVFESFSVPEFAMTDHTGEPAGSALLDGSVTVMDFFFTNCPLACPGMTREMKKIAEALQGTPVRFVSVSVDGATDTPERLRAYADENELDLSRWTLLTASQDEVRELLEEGFGQTIRVDESMRIPVADGVETLNVIHPVRLWLVGADRRVDYGALYTRQDEVELLIERAKALAAEGEG